MDQRRKVLITSIVISAGLFGVIWWGYINPDSARPSWQERLGESPNLNRRFPSAEVQRPVYVDPRSSKPAPRDRVPTEPMKPRPRVELEHVAVEITGTTSEQSTWNDPENQKVLGDKRWMAVESVAENARIEELLDRPMPIDPRVTPLDRKASIELIRPDIEACVAAARVDVPGTTGRFVVIYDLTVPDSTGVMKHANVDPLVGFEGALGLKECILQAVEGRTFPATRSGETLRVEYPFFF